MLSTIELLAKAQLVGPRATLDMLDLLERQTVNDRIPALLPEEAIIAHKTGELHGVRNDVGIVHGPGGRYIISVLAGEQTRKKQTKLSPTFRSALMNATRSEDTGAMRIPTRLRC